MKTLCPAENPDYLSQQLITYIGNKRSLLDFINEGVQFVQKRLNSKKLKTMDVFSGSGIVGRFLKQFSSHQYANDLENYACLISGCYLSNADELNLPQLKKVHEMLCAETERKISSYLNSEKTAFRKIPGFISEYYAPRDMDRIQKEERCFYTPYNACYIDVMRQLIRKNVEPQLQKFFIAPLLSQASIHANTGGVFKGFYKNSATGIGKFGGRKADALSRITGRIELPFPVFSNFKSRVSVFSEDANELALSGKAGQVDLAYIDPPYNQHPYGSNYFMLNLIASYSRPDEEMMSRVSGIPKDWNRSLYNKKKLASETFYELASNLNAKYLLISFNNEGFISEDEMISLLRKCGKVSVLEKQYNTFRASRNLSGREIHTKEYLYIVEK